MSGSAMAIPWETEGEGNPGHGDVGAIVQAWYPGQTGGRTPSHDVLFGDYNPSGKLPITFYKSTTDLPAFTDYAMASGPRDGGPPSLGRTYRYFSGAPQWAFGHGLSYSTFRYSSATLSKAEATTAKTDETITLSVDVTNTSPRDGEEVVQLYARQTGRTAPDGPIAGDAIRRLVGFQRISVPAGKIAHVEIPVPVIGLRVWDEAAAKYVVRPGTYTLEVAEEAGDIRETAELRVTGK